MKRIISALLLILISISCFVSCGDDGYEDVTYKENGIEFFLPSSMRRFEDEGYDFYFSNLTTGMIFTAKKLDEEMLKSLDIEYGITAVEYAEEIIERNYLEKDKLHYEYDEKRGHVSFRYNFVDDNEVSVFYYIVVTGEPDNLWYIEMCCDNENSSEYIQTFEVWKKNIKTYE